MMRSINSLGKVSFCWMAVILMCTSHWKPIAAEITWSPAEAAKALRKAVEFFTTQVAVEGGYGWRYSADLSKREGEGKIGDTTVWIQPPGTPYIGEAYVYVYRLTHDPFYLQAARETAMALVKGQMHSGGWYNHIEFAPADRIRYAYRIDGKPSERARNQTTLDDDKTQSAIRFLIQYDKAADFQDQVVHEAVLFALDSVINAQFPNGGWPQVYDRPAEPHPVAPARYSESDEYQRVKEYWKFYTLNDNVIRDVIDTLLLAARVYRDERYLRSAMQGGKFLVLAQMPEPQPAWAQQYDFEMRPTWARKFEPPAITGNESQNVMIVLMDLYEETGDRAFLEPIPKALAYLKRSLLPDGRLARFYELKTNKPLYFTKEYELTYSDDDMPTHYSFKSVSRLDAIERRYRKLSSASWQPPKEEEEEVVELQSPSLETVKQIIERLDSRGAWVEQGRLRYWGDDDPTTEIIDPRTFARNIKILAEYLAANNSSEP